MKFKKLLIISFVFVILFSFFVVSVSAAEQNPDPSKFVVAIDDEYYYYDIAGDNWEELIEYANSRVDDFPFAIIGDLVIYNNNYLTLRNMLVHSYDSITNSTGAGYYLGDNVYTVNDNELKFSSLVPETMTFVELINILPNSNFNLGGYNSNYVFYDSMSLSFNDRTLVRISNNIGTGITYYLSEACKHSGYYTQTTILPNCTEEGLAINHCISCGYEWTVSLPIDSNLHTSLDSEVTYVFATCTKDGYKSYNCSRCGILIEETLEAYGHSFTEATCLEASKCIRCGIYTGSVTGHNLNYKGICQTPGCSYSYIVEVGKDIKNGANDFWNWLTGAADDGESWFDGLGSDLSEFGESVAKGFRVILIVTGIVAGLALLSVLLNLFDKITKATKNLSQRFKRKK